MEGECWVHSKKGDGSHRRTAGYVRLDPLESKKLSKPSIHFFNPTKEKEKINVPFSGLQGCIFGANSPVFRSRPDADVQKDDAHCCLTVLSDSGAVNVSFSGDGAEDSCAEMVLDIQQAAYDFGLAKTRASSYSALVWMRCAFKLGVLAQKACTTKSMVLVRLLAGVREDVDEEERIQNIEEERIAAEQEAVRIAEEAAHVAAQQEAARVAAEEAATALELFGEPPPPPPLSDEDALLLEEYEKLAAGKARAAEAKVRQEEEAASAAVQAILDAQEVARLAEEAEQRRKDIEAQQSSMRDALQKERIAAEEEAARVAAELEVARIEAEAEAARLAEAARVANLSWKASYWEGYRSDNDSMRKLIRQISKANLYKTSPSTSERSTPCFNFNTVKGCRDCNAVFDHCCLMCMGDHPVHRKKACMEPLTSHLMFSKFGHLLNLPGLKDPNAMPPAPAPPASSSETPALEPNPAASALEQTKSTIDL